jgi:hypothetical protein
MIFSQQFHLFDFKTSKTGNTLRTSTWPLINFYFPQNSVYGMSHPQTAYRSIERNTCPVVPRFYPFSKESSIKSRLVIHTVANLPGWDSWLTKFNTNWSTITSCICNHPMTSFGSQYPTGNGPLYIDSDYSRIFNQKTFIWKTEKLHMTTWDTSRVFCTSDITSPESTPTYQTLHVFHSSYHIQPTNIKIQTCPTRLPHFFNFLWKLPNPSRFAIHPPILS